MVGLDRCVKQLHDGQVCWTGVLDKCVFVRSPGQVHVGRVCRTNVLGRRMLYCCVGQVHDGQVHVVQVCLSYMCWTGELNRCMSDRRMLHR